MANVYVCLYDSFRQPFSRLSLREKGIMLDAMQAYHIDGAEPDFGKNRVLKVLWEVVKQQMDRDAGQYTAKAEAGKRGGQAKVSTNNSASVCLEGGKQSQAEVSTNNSASVCLPKEKENEKENEKEKDTHTETSDVLGQEAENTETGVCVSEGDTTPLQEEFMQLWRETKDDKGSCIFSLGSSFDNYKDWQRLWAERPWTSEEMRRAFKNIADAVSSGKLERRYIPRHPDKLAADMSRYLEPIKAAKRINAWGIDEDKQDAFLKLNGYA